jgi:hypothetical protein
MTKKTPTTLQLEQAKALIHTQRQEITRLKQESEDQRRLLTRLRLVTIINSYKWEIDRCLEA